LEDAHEIAFGGHKRGRHDQQRFTADWGDAHFEGIETIKYLSDLEVVSASGSIQAGLRRQGNRRLLEDPAAGPGLWQGIGCQGGLRDQVTNLDKKYELFSAILGVDDSASGAGSVVFEVWGDATAIFQSAILRVTRRRCRWTLR